MDDPNWPDREKHGAFLGDGKHFIPQCHIIQSLGSGTDGEVSLYEYGPTGRRYAVKVAAPDEYACR